MYERRENPDFSWSNSRKEMFDDCKRAYYYHYYGSHNGWESGADYAAYQAYHLKNTLSMPLAFAKGVQHAVGRFVGVYQRRAAGDSAEEMKAGDFTRIVKESLHAACMKTADKAGWQARPRQNPMLIEKLNYHAGLKAPAVQAVIEKIKGQFDDIAKNFFASPTVKEIQGGAEVVENYEDFGSGSFLMGSQKNSKVILKVWGKADTVHKKDGKYIATLWRTGTQPKDEAAERFHAEVIIIYLCMKYHLKGTDGLVRVCDLNTGKTKTYAFKDKAEYEKALEGIRDSAGMMAGYLENKDITVNKALPMDKFPQKKNHEDCRSCPFFLLCVQEAQNKKKPEPEKKPEPKKAA